MPSILSQCDVDHLQVTVAPATAVGITPRALFRLPADQPRLDADSPCLPAQMFVNTLIKPLCCSFSLSWLGDTALRQLFDRAEMCLDGPPMYT